MCRVIGFALFFVAIGLMIAFFLSDFGAFMLMLFLLTLAYLLFCR